MTGSNGAAARKRWSGIALLIASLGFILRVTLVPASGPDTGAFQWCLLCGSFGLSDAIANIALFVPLGIALRCSGVSGRRTIALALLLSTAIEIAQLWIPGRESTLGDIVTNTTGAALGVGLWAWYPVRRRFRLSGIVAAAAALAVIAGTGLLLRPSFPPTVYYGQWTADLGMYDWYRGKVLSADIGGSPLPSWRLQDSRMVRQRLMAGEPLRVRAVAGPRTDRLGPLFSIFDEQRREILLVGVDRDDLVFTVSTSAVDLRLRQPELRWSHALVAVAPGDTLVISAWRTRKGYCLQLNGRSRCGLAYATDQLWRLIASLPHRFAGDETVVGYVFMALLGLPAGLLAPRRAAGGLAAAALLLGAVLLPPSVGLATIPSLDIAALALGIAAGALVPAGAPPLGGALTDGLPH